MKKVNKGDSFHLLSPSSSWRENPNPRRKKSTSVVSDVGCLPSFLHLLFRNPRKSLTFGSKKREQRTVVCVPPAETRSHAPHESHARPHDGEGETARMSLVGALEKCDRDLEELRRTIDVIKSTFFLQHQKLPLPPPAAPDHFKLSHIDHDPIRFNTGGDVLHQEKKTKAQEEPVKDKDKNTTKHKPYTNNNNIDLIKTDFNVADHMVAVPKRSPRTSGVRKSKSMVESVEQVCDDVAWGERRELGRIGLALHDHICRDLISDTVLELCFSFSGDFSSPYPAIHGRHRRRGSATLHLDACRRRLLFS